MKITTVILFYYQQRRQNLPKLVDTLLNGSRKPDKILILNNNPDVTLKPIKGTTILNSSQNFVTRARFAIALLEPSDYYLFVDDDLMVEKDTLKNFERYADSDYCLGYFGKNIDWGKKDKYTSAITVKATEITEPMIVDVIVGRIYLVSMKALLNFFRVEPKLAMTKNRYLRSVEDVAISSFNKCKIIPAKDWSFIHSFEEDKIGLSHNPQHLLARNQFLEKVALIKKGKTIICQAKKEKLFSK